ncbi:MAG: ribosome small subunit-dependent GTPase A [Rhodothermia bacterium]|nr:MAG: ribosome small subunit-dependent GTPase A [Rhodothermia bacterium]
MSDLPPKHHPESGVVVRSTGSWYDVDVSGQTLSCRVRGKFRLEGADQTTPVVVGDRVSLQMQPDGTGMIVSIEDRFNCVSRRAAGRKVGKEHVIVANVDAAWVIQSVLLPKINPGFIDRFIAMADLYHIPVGVVINKCDLIEEEFADAITFWSELYSGIGYTVIHTSATTGDGVETFATELKNKTSAIVGPSGVGKSSLLNQIEPELGLRVGEVSMRTQKGTHTTTFAALYPLSFGGYVVDTPGLREYGLIDIEPETLSHHFIEFESFSDECKFPNCTHDHEPDCRVKEAVESGEISVERYESYLNMLFSLRQGEKDVGR